MMTRRPLRNHEAPRRSVVIGRNLAPSLAALSLVAGCASSGSAPTPVAPVAPPPTSAHPHHHHHVTTKPTRAVHHHKHKRRPTSPRPHHHHSADAVAPATHTCTLTSTGNCIRGGEFCPNADAGQPGYDAEGRKYICRDGNWEVP